LTPEQELIYLAGFFDGEGSVGIYRARMTGASGVTHRLTIRMEQCNPEPLRLFARRFGGRVIANRLRSATARRQATYYWAAFSRRAETVIRAIRPWLLVKAAEADLALGFRASATDGRRHGLTPWDLAERDSFLEAIHDAKRYERAAVVGPPGG
jgi:hypothetical protein